MHITHYVSAGQAQVLSLVTTPAIFPDSAAIKRVETLRIGSTSRKKDLIQLMRMNQRPQKKKTHCFCKGCQMHALLLHFSVDLGGGLLYQRFKRGTVCLESSCACTSEKLNVI
jgi:hypothetical protein